jgi:uncharacterized protein affecting Mg2+/Co2+ transport
LKGSIEVKIPLDCSTRQLCCRHWVKTDGGSKHYSTRCLTLPVDNQVYCRPKHSHMYWFALFHPMPHVASWQSSFWQAEALTHVLTTNWSFALSFSPQDCSTSQLCCRYWVKTDGVQVLFNRVHHSLISLKFTKTAVNFRQCSSELQTVNTVRTWRLTQLLGTCEWTCDDSIADFYCSLFTSLLQSWEGNLNFLKTKLSTGFIIVSSHWNSALNDSEHANEHVPTA